MAHINGSNLRIFPASNRSAADQQNNNWLTEFNLSSIVNQLISGTDIKGFVITAGDSESTISLRAGEPQPDSPGTSNASATEVLEKGVLADSFIKASSSIEFNIAGYYFQVKSVQDIVNACNNQSVTNPASYLTFSKDGSNMYIATAHLSGDKQYRVLLGSDSDDTDPTGGEDIKLNLFYEKNGKYYIPASSRINFSGIQTFKHKDTRTQFTVKGAQITNYIIDDGEL